MNELVDFRYWHERDQPDWSDDVRYAEDRKGSAPRQNDANAPLSDISRRFAARALKTGYDGVKMLNRFLPRELLAWRTDYDNGTCRGWP